MPAHDARSGEESAPTGPTTAASARPGGATTSQVWFGPDDRPLYG